MIMWIDTIDYDFGFFLLVPTGNKADDAPAISVLARGTFCESPGYFRSFPKAGCSVPPVLFGAACPKNLPMRTLLPKLVLWFSIPCSSSRIQLVPAKKEFSFLSDV